MIGTNGDVVFIEAAKHKACQTHEPAGTLMMHKVLNSGSPSVPTQEGVYGQPPWRSSISYGLL